MKKNIYLIYLLILLSFHTANAGTFYVLINASGGIAAVDTLVQQGHQHPTPSNYLMDALTTYPPTSVNYLIFDRPTGNLLNLVNQSPDWSTARLYRTIVIEYPFATDATPILQSFQTDALVESVDYQSAVLNPIVFVPEPLLSDSSVLVNIAMNTDCNELGVPGLNIQGLSYNINRIGNIIELEAIMNIFPPAQPTICTNQSNTYTPYDLGQLPAGQYQLKIYKVYGNPAFPIPPSQRDYLGEKNFQVISAFGGSQPIPTLTFLGLLVLCFLLIFNVRNRAFCC